MSTNAEMESAVIRQLGNPSGAAPGGIPDGKRAAERI